MKLTLEQNEATFDVPEQGALLIGNDEDCQVQINRPEIWGRHASITATGYGLVLKVESTPIDVNGISIKSNCLLYPGDELVLAGLSMLLVDDDYIPKAVKATDELERSSNTEELSSVFGLRQLTGERNGAFIKSGYHHEDGWDIYRNGAKLALMSNNQAVFVNGQRVDNTWLKNGDRIRYHNDWFNVECPGHSGYSKFSPSHPRNVMLSEALTDSETEQNPTHSWRSHYWWITLLIGLLVLVAVILVQ